jgi:HopA1 effector protein family
MIQIGLLYQRYEHLEQAIVELNHAFKPCCLTHNDLKLNNILIHNNWEQIIARSVVSDRAETITESECIVRAIDWERWAWGDPAFDLGTPSGSYLKIWLSSLVINPDIDIATALSIAKTPLDLIQPSIASLTIAYLVEFPEIIERNPDFLSRVVQFAGLALIEQIRATIYYHEPFSNIGICMLEVTKTLLCDPVSSIPIVFGYIGDLVAIRMPSNLMDDGCYVAVGNVGNAGKIATSEAIDIYFNLSSQGAIALMKAITKQLNKINLPFTFKVIYDPSAYDCYDAGILNCARHNYAAVRQILNCGTIRNW